MTAAEEPLGSAGNAEPVALGSVAAYLDRAVSPSATVTDRQAAVVFGLTLALAALTDGLFHGGHTGVSVPLWFGALALAVGVGSRAIGRPLAPDRLLLLVLGVALSTVNAWRDAGLLQFGGFVGALALFTLAAGTPGSRPIGRTTPLTAVLAGCNMAIAGATGWFRLAGALRWRDLLSGPARQRVEAVTRALAIALPLLLVFGVLFAAADAVFAQALSGLLLPENLVAHAFLLLFGYGVASALLWPTLCARLPEQPAVARPTTHALGVTEIAIVMGSLALLFAAFVVVQVRYLFGGAEAVQASVDLTYAEYARRGYFELVTASLLLLPVLAGLDWARRREGATRTLYLALAVVLTGLLFVVMASAWQRFAIYRETFGLTEMRLYTALSLLWLGVTLLWFLLLVVRRRTDRTIAGAMLLGVACLLALYALNPHEAIVRINIERAAAGHELDVAYAASLSADAIPALLDHLPALEAAATDDVPRCMLALRFVHTAQASRDWRAWNLSRRHAQDLIAARSDIPPAPVGCSAAFLGTD